MTEDAKEMWTIDELVEMTETVQHKEIEWAGKGLNIQWCELTESEEPRMAMPDDEASDEDKTKHYSQLAAVRVITMINKANDMDKENIFITEENWSKFPSTLRWRISNKILQSEEAKSDF